MNTFTKPSLSVDQQIDQWVIRGLDVPDRVMKKSMGGCPRNPQRTLQFRRQLPIISLNTPAMPMPLRGYAQIGGFFMLMTATGLPISEEVPE